MAFLSATYNRAKQVRILIGLFQKMEVYYE